MKNKLREMYVIVMSNGEISKYSDNGIIIYPNRSDAEEDLYDGETIFLIDDLSESQKEAVENELGNINKSLF